MKKYDIPAILSLFAPAFGQLVKGHTAKMIAIWAATALLIFNWRNEWIPLGHIIELSASAYFILTAWSVYDAYNSQEDWKGMV